MSRLPLATLDRIPPSFREFMERRGDLNVFRLLANAPAVCGGWARMTDQMLDSPTFTRRMRELVILRVAHLQESGYERAQHLPLARQAGVTPAQIDAVTGDGDLDSAGFDDTEIIVLELVSELCTTRKARDGTFAAAHAALGTEAVTELLMIVSLYYGLALILNAVELDIDEHSRLGA
ncbi:carboxymuconolactone decarboxylase family protein [Streptosporangium subroseum]|uniref:carboxymuconolactone decarboxylase family protein n=1 Tax=Streptosporangium subroseum TaxID=106412 RepID=UPI003087870D|nr:carboxymuconolactone decarboxylase family protein [Streptosporangium subroseum]